MSRFRPASGFMCEQKAGNGAGSPLRDAMKPPSPMGVAVASVFESCRPNRPVDNSAEVLRLRSVPNPSLDRSPPLFRGSEPLPGSSFHGARRLMRAAESADEIEFEATCVSFCTAKGGGLRLPAHPTVWNLGKMNFAGTSRLTPPARHPNPNLAEAKTP